MQSLGYKAGTIRARNRKLIFDLVTAQGPMARSAIARRLKLSVTAVSDILSELQGVGLVKEAGPGPSDGGRPPTLIEASAETVCLLGLSLNAGEIRALLADPGGGVIGKVIRPTEAGRGPEVIIEQLIEAGREVLDVHQRQLTLLAFGLAVSAPVSLHGQIRPPDLPGWDSDNIPVLDPLKRAFAAPGVVDNDANLGALAELRYGNFATSQNLAYVLVHRGVGAGIVYQGDIFRGSMNWAGELGHTVINPAGPRCDCGNFGCLESFVTTRKLLEYTIQGARLGRPTSLEPLEVEQLEPRAVIEAALAGDRAATAALAQLGEWLGLGLANLVSIINPEVVILGGPLARAGRLVLEPAEQVARQRLLPGLREQVLFATSSLGGDGPALGAVAYALDQLLEQEDFIFAMKGALSA